MLRRCDIRRLVDMSDYTIVAVDPIESDDALPTSCGAKLRGKDAYCGKAPGDGTDHPGRGRCRLHGGNSPVRHGRYSLIKSERLQAILQHVQQDTNPLDLTAEVEMLRVLFVDYVNRYEEYTEALLAWHASWLLKFIPTERMIMSLERAVTEWEIVLYENNVPNQRDKEDVQNAKAFINYYRQPDNARPRQVVDISDAKNILAELGKMVERIEKIRAANAISRPELNRIYQEMWRAVDALVESEEAKKEIKKSWLSIAL